MIICPTFVRRSLRRSPPWGVPPEVLGLRFCFLGVLRFAIVEKVVTVPNPDVGFYVRLFLNI
jgi:hypothetical protein